MPQLYDRLGANYDDLRRPDRRIATRIRDALGDAESVVNVGAGAGSYEPEDRRVFAVEPSARMIAQRRRPCAGIVRAVGNALPFADGSFDAGLAVLTLHHWSDPLAGVIELLRVARRRVVILTWDPEFEGFWLTDYFPDILAIDAAIFPTLATFRDCFDCRIEDVAIPADCTDGFLGAYWKRPEAYLDERTRFAMSTFSKIDDEVVAAGLARLENDLRTGEWRRRYGNDADSTHLGYRLLVIEKPRPVTP